MYIHSSGMIVVLKVASWVSSSIFVACYKATMSLDPETSVHEALDSAIATYAVIWFGLPGNKTRFPIADWLSACEDPIATDSNPSAVANGVCIAVGAASISFCPEDANEPVSII